MLVFSKIYHTLKWAQVTARNYLFYTRNSFFQILYLFLVTTFHAKVIHDGLAAVRMQDPQSYHLPFPLALAVLNLGTFIICCYSDPGVIKKGQRLSYLSNFLFDGKLFIPNARCPTCGIIKPARSKHCRLTNRCIYKFDHYCIWVANAIGGNNHRYFLLLLSTLLLMLISGCYNTIKVVRALNKIFKFWEIAQLRSTRVTYKFLGQYQNVNFLYLQMLASNFPWLVMIQISCVILTLAVGYFFCFHLYLVIRNETTNEKYKRWALKRRPAELQGKDDAGSHCKDSPVYRNIYCKSVWQNILEEVWPVKEISKDA